MSTQKRAFLCPEIVLIFLKFGPEISLLAAGSPV